MLYTLESNRILKKCHRVGFNPRIHVRYSSCSPCSRDTYKPHNYDKRDLELTKLDLTVYGLGLIPRHLLILPLRIFFASGDQVV
jgi:hypothetical protein